jgi:hypothetical protein
MSVHHVFLYYGKSHCSFLKTYIYMESSRRNT